MFHLVLALLSIPYEHCLFSTNLNFHSCCAQPLCMGLQNDMKQLPSCNYELIVFPLRFAQGYKQQRVQKDEANMEKDHT